MRGSIWLGTAIITFLLAIIVTLSYLLVQKYESRKLDFHGRSTTNSTTVMPARTGSEATGITPLTKEQQARLIDEFMKKMTITIKPYTEMITEYNANEQSNPQQENNATISMFASMAFQELVQDLLHIPFPEGLEPEHATMLEKVRDYVVQGYHYFSDAMEYFDQYTNTGKEEWKVRYHEAIELAQDSMTKSVSQLNELYDRLRTDHTRTDRNTEHQPKPLPVAERPPLSRETLEQGYFAHMEFGLGSDFNEVKAKWGEVPRDQEREGGVGYFYSQCSCAIFTMKENKNRISSIELKPDHLTLQHVVDALGKPTSEGWDEMEGSYLLFYSLSGRKEIYVRTELTTSDFEAPAPSPQSQIATVSLIQK
ncbi:hypothetical protein [Paenibacillus sp. YYML68]|uniref:hypothetical protein n=1 Tax=Paenibacillus sp. YYML68 TaxID=2909250 RepID=UPI0024900C69|nr:hypothetical protein [Paenibacillus sp. YYML68]